MACTSAHALSYAEFLQLPEDQGLAYLVGVGNGLSWANGTMKAPAKLIFCQPSVLTGDQYRKVFWEYAAEYLKDREDRDAMPFEMIMAQAMAKAFPCE